MDELELERKREEYVDTIAVLLEDHLRGQPVQLAEGEIASRWDLLVRGNLVELQRVIEEKSIDEDLFEGTRDVLLEGKPLEEARIILEATYVDTLVRLLERAMKPAERQQLARRQALDEWALLSEQLFRVTPDQLHKIRRDLERRQRGSG